ncbi:hypothetical protein [Nostoc sp. FACHB-110]|uniref:hypothetical protein n=1 Tax=Nostoc sp. FACHB-110 TaxID=2692834 RepID=UPI001685FC7E|nr:hypothetical protein [Nostoc sp. FACHB-110]MBD2435602.1 hypothetical protein [Nostoc sp. FACHB-110]
MQIIEQTSTKLSLEDNNWQWLWGIMFSIPFVTVGLLIITTTSNLTKLECQRNNSNAITCQRTIISLFGTEITRLPGQLKKAAVVTEHGTGVVVYTSSGIGAIELVNHRVFIKEKHYKITETINAFINNPQQLGLKIQQDDRWSGFLEGMVFLLPSIAIIFQSLAIPKQIFCQFDKSSDQIIIKKQHQALGIFTQITKLSEVLKVSVTQMPLASRTPWYLIQLELKLGKLVSISSPTRDYKRYQQIVNTINYFIKSKDF